MFQYTALEWLARAAPLLGVTGLIIALLIVATPVLRREPATPRRRRAAAVLAVIALIVAAPLAVMSWSWVFSACCCSADWPSRPS